LSRKLRLVGVDVAAHDFVAGEPIPFAHRPFDHRAGAFEVQVAQGQPPSVPSLPRQLDDNAIVILDGVDDGVLILAERREEGL
jgi:hypothetical protein